jgi:hypothetical protein
VPKAALALAVGVALAPLPSASARAADEVAMLDGTTLRGRITGLTSDSVSIRTHRGMSVTLPLDRVHVISTAQGRRVVNEKKEPARAPASPGRSPAAPAVQYHTARPAPKPSQARGEREARGSRQSSSSRGSAVTPPAALEGWWKRAAKARAYAEATAWEPLFEDRQLWPQLTGKERFLEEKWPEGRLYIWAHPGKDGDIHARRNSLNPADPSNWLENGRPAKELVLDERTDLHFPASKERYRVGFRRTSLRPVFRHVTVEPGADFVGGGDGKGRQIHGNVWVKEGGSIYAQGSTAFVGDRHTFFRNDNEGGGSQYFVFGTSASVELLGHVTTSDEWRLDRGTAIVGPYSLMQPGRAATPRIRSGGTLVLMSGAYWGKWCNSYSGPLDLDVRGGKILGGLPERPLRSDCTLALSFRNWSGLDFSAFGDRGSRMNKRKVSAVLEPGAEIRVHSADLERARLVITRYELHDPLNNKRGYMHHIGEYFGRNDKKKGLFADPKLVALFDSKPHKTQLFIASGVTVEGPVVFDHLPASGLLVESAGVAASWRDVSYGKNNLGGPEEIVRVHGHPAKDGSF